MSTTPKYTNQTQFVDGAAEVDEQLSQGEQLVLNALAQRGDYRTFQSHPGNAKLIRRARVGTRQGLNYILKKLEAKKLISKISDGDGGRGLATVYRILVEDSRFPVPGRKALKPASNSLQVSTPDTRKCDSENPQVDAAKPASRGTLNPQELTCTPPLLPSLKTIQPPSEPTAEGWILKTNAAIGAVPNSKEQKELEKLFAQHGDEIMTETVWQFECRPQGLVGMQRPWLIFLREFPTHVRTATKNIAQLHNTYEWKKVHDPAAAARDDAFYWEQMKPYRMQCEETLRKRAEREAEEAAGPTLDDILSEPIAA
jgi:hypothetical protein